MMCRLGYLAIPDPAKLWSIASDGFEEAFPTRHLARQRGF
jgi:hypothetical protein